MADDWSIEVGPVEYTECQHCGADMGNRRYCDRCRATGAAEATESTHTDYPDPGRSGSQWAAAEPTPVTIDADNAGAAATADADATVATDGGTRAPAAPDPDSGGATDE